jgi:hypothetical protein
MSGDPGDKDSHDSFCLQWTIIVMIVTSTVSAASGRESILEISLTPCPIFQSQEGEGDPIIWTGPWHQRNRAIPNSKFRIPNSRLAYGSMIFADRHKFG